MSVVYLQSSWFASTNTDTIIRTVKKRLQVCSGIHLWLSYFSMSALLCSEGFQEDRRYHDVRAVILLLTPVCVLECVFCPVTLSPWSTYATFKIHTPSHAGSRNQLQATPTSLSWVGQLALKKKWKNWFSTCEQSKDVKLSHVSDAREVNSYRLQYLQRTFSILNPLKSPLNHSNN